MPGKVKVRIVAGRNLPVMDRASDTCDAFVEIKLSNTTYKTEVFRHSLNPEWNSEWFRFEVDDEELQDEPLQIRVMDYDTYSANDAIGKVYIDLNPLLCKEAGSLLSGWFPIYDTMHGIRGEINVMVRVHLFSDSNKYRESSCGVQFFYSCSIPWGYKAQAILGFVEELVVNDDPEYQWIDKIRTPRASNEARQTLFSKLSAICVKYVFDVSMKVRNGILGPMSPDLNIMNLLRDRMDLMLPPDAHLHCDGRLHASVTRFDNGQNVLLNNFKSRDELLQALMCSCFIPVYCGYQPPVFHGVEYVDAAMSNNSPWLDQHTVTVAPFSGHSNICPKNDSLLCPTAFTLSNTSIEFTTKNMYMLFRVLFPGSPDIQKEFCQQGYNDALRFLRDNDLVPCPGCVATKKHGHANCGPIEELLPTEITDEFENSLQEFRKNLGYRLFQYRSMKVLYYINIPSIVTAKVTYVAISTILQKVKHKAEASVDELWCHVLQALKEKLLHRTNSRIKGTTREKTEKQLESNDSGDSNGETSVNELDSGIYEEDTITNSKVTSVEIEVPKNNSTPVV